MLLLPPTRYRRGNDHRGLLFWHSAAKNADVLDHQVFAFTHGLISGHSLQNLLAAWLLRMLWLRQPLWQSPATRAR